MIGITSSHPIFPIIPRPEFFGAFWGVLYNHHPYGVNNHPVKFRLLPFRGMAQPEMLMFCIKHFWKKNTNQSKCEEFGNVHINLLFETKLNCWKTNEPKTGWCSTTQPFFGPLVGELSLSSSINEHSSSEITPNG